MNLDSIEDCTKFSINNDQKNKVHELVKKSLRASKAVESIIKTSYSQLAGEDKNLIFDVNKEINNTLVLLESKANKLGIDIKFSFKESVKILGCPVKLSRVIANLVMNSIDSFTKINRNLPQINISTEIKNKFLLIKISDNGCGIKDKYKEEVFKPLFSTKRASGSVGLGLYISQTIIKKYFNGDISFSSVVGKGSEFIIHIPLS